MSFRRTWVDPVDYCDREVRLAPMPAEDDAVGEKMGEKMQKSVDKIWGII